MEKSKKDFINRVAQHWLLRNIILGRDVLYFIACQFALESNFGTSRLAISQNNYCGMKIPHKRLHYGFNSDNDFACYHSFDDCIKDYVSFLLYNRPNNIQFTYLDSFMIFLQNTGYCPEKGYIDRITSIYQQFNI